MPATMAISLAAPRHRDLPKDANKLINGVAWRNCGVRDEGKRRGESRSRDTPEICPPRLFSFRFNFSLPETQIFAGTFILDEAGASEMRESGK